MREQVVLIITIIVVLLTHHVEEYVLYAQPLLGVPPRSDGIEHVPDAEDVCLGETDAL